MAKYDASAFVFQAETSLSNELLANASSVSAFASVSGVLCTLSAVSKLGNVEDFVGTVVFRSVSMSPVVSRFVCCVESLCVLLGATVVRSVSAVHWSVHLSGC